MGWIDRSDCTAVCGWIHNNVLCSMAEGCGKDTFHSIRDNHQRLQHKRNPNSELDSPNVRIRDVFIPSSSNLKYKSLQSDMPNPRIEWDIDNERYRPLPVLVRMQGESMNEQQINPR